LHCYRQHSFIIRALIELDEASCIANEASQQRG
jgi:hypothetical protein